MDKKQFLETAPYYYALAMIAALNKKGKGKQAMSLSDIRDIYSYTDEESNPLEG